MVQHGQNNNQLETMLMNGRIVQYQQMELNLLFVHMMEEYTRMMVNHGQNSNLLVILINDGLSVVFLQMELSILFVMKDLEELVDYIFMTVIIGSNSIPLVKVPFNGLHVL